MNIDTPHRICDECKMESTFQKNLIKNVKKKIKNLKNK